MKRKIRKARALFFGLLVLGFLAWVQQSGFETVLELRAAWRAEAALEEQVAALKADNDRLEQEIEELEHNGRRVEEIARGKLGYAREGEIVIRIPEKR